MATSGIGGAIDVGSIVSQLMAVERQPLQSLQKSISGIQTKLSAFGKLQGQLSTLQDSARQLFALDTWRSAKATSSDETAVKATAADGATPGAYDLVVTQLAQRQTVASSTFAASSTVVGGGTLTIQLGTYASGTNTFSADAAKPAVAVAIDADSTLAQVRDAINAADAGVSASIVNNGSGAQLVLRSDATGLTNTAQITVTDNDTDDTDTAGLSQLAFDPTAPVGAGKNMVQSQAAQDAQLSVSGIAVTSPTNQVSGVIENVTLDLSKAGTGPLSINVAYDTAQMRETVNKFVSAWNALNSGLAEQTRFDPTSKSAGPLQGNNTVLAMQRQLRNILQANMGGTGLSGLSAAGIELQRDGSLAVKSAKLDTLLTNPDQLKTLFGSSSTTDASMIGIARRLDTLLTGILGSDGAVSGATAALRSRQTSVQQQQSRFELRLTQIEERLTRQYTALDTNMSKLNSASSFLSSKFG